VTPTIVSWSHSRAVDFERCRFKAKLKYIDKIPEPERPLPPGKVEHANDRGTRIHEACELFVRGDGALPKEAIAFKDEFEGLKALHTQGRVSIEGEWGMARDWTPTDWKTAWLRLKLDALVFISDLEAIAIDYKTGKKFGNELKHAEQLQLYQLVTFLRYPMLETITTELWYLDQDEITAQTFRREQGLRFQRNWERRGNDITTCSDFPPNPNIHSCRYCPFGPGGTGHCLVGKA
jgi:hypothetical protein